MPKRVLQGVVVSDKNDKTVVVQVERRLTHPVLKKTVRLTKKYHAHDEVECFPRGRRCSYSGMSSDFKEQAVGGFGSGVCPGVLRLK